jgi:HTH-type transcriptional regulator/antitoxin HigA
MTRKSSSERLMLHPIRTQADYEAALKRAEACFDAPEEIDPDSAEGAYFDALLTLIEAYERKHYPIDPPDPVDAIRFRMEQQGLTPKDLQPMIGRLNRVYEVLNRRRPLTLAMVRRLHAQLGIPAESLIRA